MKPKRIQRRRTKGWRMPEGAVYVGRPTKWGNPFRVGDEYGPYKMLLQNPRTILSAKEALKLYKRHLFNIKSADLPIFELRGRDLACWCPLDQPCHADVLLEIANSEESR